MRKNHKNFIFFIRREAVDKQKLIDTSILMLPDELTITDMPPSEAR